MKNKFISKFSISLLFVVFFISGCTATTAPTNQSTESQDTVTTVAQKFPPSSNTSTQSTSDESESSNIAETPLSDSVDEQETEPIPTRQVPDDFDWMSLPIMPEMSDTIVEIYKKGIEQGRNPENFSTIGDCQAIPFVFMGPIGRRELLPPSQEQYLWDAIYHFDSSFEHESITARGGFTAASILNPMQADPSQCKPGETPLTCEYRLHNPAFVFITLETWLNPDTVDRYESYLRDIVEYVIQHGSVPILLTKADTSESKDGVQIINPAIAKIAYEYDIPLVNFKRAVQYLPNYGIDPGREGFHLSQDGYDRKNILALQALYLAWQKIETDLALSASPSITPTAAATPTPSVVDSAPSVEILANPDCPEGCVYFGLAQSQDGDVKLQGVFAYETHSKELIQILLEGFDLQDIHPNGKDLLVNSENFLYSIDLEDSSSELLSSTFYWQGEQGAYWTENSSEEDFVYIDTEKPYQGDTGEAIRLFPAGQNQSVFFESGACSSFNLCTSEGIYQQSPDQDALLLEDTLRPVFSPDGNWYAFLNPNAATAENRGNIDYFLMQDPNRGIASRRVFYLPAKSGFMVFPDVRAYAFSPQSDKLFIYYDIYSAYYEKSLRFETFLLDLNTGIMEDYGEMSGNSGSFRPKIIWSPDGEKILFFLTDKVSETQYALSVYETMLGSDERLALQAENIYSGDNYFYLTNIGWQKP